MTLQEMGKRAKQTAFVLGQLSTPDKDRGLKAAAEALVAHADEIIAANETDMKNGREKGLNAGLLDRLMLNEERIAGLADGIMDIVKLDDPIGAVEDMTNALFGKMHGKPLRKITDSRLCTGIRRNFGERRIGVHGADV